eukprot:gnl/MRDRNA2_/MRDRNA2_267353_c0_seq1.p1 gnl/MRDRNA2_/MRDRNA2_267353_c0~~gnl/MRDRNA2_/MRDRNA2_267353_c0_seq1.p1  ORF type:complete len:131 (-),score=3.88 gnl/MRDRNA2_/MRDRNA2_267353_c0_seq1:156-548(-)
MMCTRTDQCSVASCIRPNPVRSHCLHQRNRLQSLPTLRASTDHCSARGVLRQYLLRDHRLQKDKRVLSLTSLLTHCDGCIVTNDVKCCSFLTIFQQLKWNPPTCTMRARDDCCTVGGRVRPYLLSVHGLQ